MFLLRIHFLLVLSEITDDDIVYFFFRTSDYERWLTNLLYVGRRATRVSDAANARFRQKTLLDNTNGTFETQIVIIISAWQTHASKSTLALSFEWWR